MKRFTNEQNALHLSNILVSYYACKTIRPLYDAGVSWYAVAHAEAVKLSTEFNVSLDTACGVIAALSPNNKWERNVIDAWSTFEVVQANRHADILDLIPLVVTPTYEPNKIKALRIALGEDALTVLGGNKVRAFYTNIFYAGGDAGVTVDGHAYHIAAGIVKDSITKVPSLSDSNYADLVASYTQAAFHINSYRTSGDTVSPAQVQAVTWCYQRHIRNIH